MNSTVRCAIAAAVIALVLPAAAHAQIRAEVYVSGVPNAVAFVQDPANPAVQFVVQVSGEVRVIENGTLLPGSFLSLVGSISSGGERGLLGLAFPPDTATSRRFYVFFTNPQGHLVVSRFRRSAANPLAVEAGSRFDLLWSIGTRFIPHADAGNHNGGNLAFGPDGYLYIGTGDGGGANDPNHNAQNPASLLGKLLRIDVNVPDNDPQGFDIPPTNPFRLVAQTREEIWAFGLRNPWRFSFDAANGALIIGDVGQGAREEIDYEPAGRGGRNYGWRNFEGTRENLPSPPPAFQPLTAPIFEYGRSSGQSVTGGFVYRGSALSATYRGRYFFADFVAGRVWSLQLTVDPGSGEATASGLIDHTAELSANVSLGNISAFGVDSHGELYLCSFGGTILRIVAGPPRTSPIVQIDAPAPGATVGQPFLLGGWAIDAAAQGSTGISTLHVWAFPSSGAAPIFLGVPLYGGNRPDVGAFFGPQFTPSAFGLSVTGLAPGGYRLMVFGWVNAIGNFGIVRSVDVTVVATTRLAVDSPRPNASLSRPFLIGGWAIDTRSISGTGVDTIHVWAYPVAGGTPTFLGVPALGGSRPDVGAFFGSRFTPSGYNLVVSSLPPGTYYIVVYAHSAVSNMFDAAEAVVVTVR